MKTKTRYTLWSVTRGQRWRYLGAVLAMGLTNLFIFGPVLVSGGALDVIDKQDFAYGTPLLVDIVRGLAGGDSFVAYLWVAALAALLMTGFGGVFLFARGRFAAVASEAIVRGLRERLYARLHDLHSGFYDTADTGDLVQRASSDVETLRVFLASDVVEIGRAIMLLLCVTPILVWLEPRLAALSLCLMPFLAAGAYVFFSRVKDVFLLTDESEAAMTAVLQENLTGIRVVRAFARQSYEVEKFGAKNAEFRNNNYRLMRLMAVYWSTSDLFALSQIGIVLIGGGMFVLDGSITVGTLFEFVTLVGIVIWPVRQLGRVLTDSGKAVVSLGRINEVLGEAQEAAGLRPAQGRTAGEIDIRGLHFEYQPDRPVLQDLTVHIPAGETLAIVGPPGSGKSSLIKVLLRLYPYQAGSVRLDGQEVSELDRHWLRAQIGVVLQDPFLYSRSVRANLLVGRPAAPDHELLEACDDAAIRDAIVGFEDGFDAMVGERGVTLSGGQRQRLALARALLKDPPVLVLDDSLSAVDTGTEADILAALERRKGRHTTLVIAHRLSTVMHADRIMVLDAGRVAQLGDHATLAAQPGPYRTLCEIQGALDASIRADVRSTEGSHG